MKEVIGENVEALYDRENGRLILTIDLKKEGIPSASGKSLVLATTRGNAEFAGVRIGLNVYRKRTFGR